MGFNIIKAVSRAIGVPDKYMGLVGVAVPFIGASQLAVNVVTGQPVATGFVQSKAAHPIAPQFDAQTPGSQFIVSNTPNSVDPHFSPYYQPVYSGSYLDTQGYGPYAGYGGPTQWDYSTLQPTYSAVQTVPSATYSQDSQGSIWEDLAPLALAFL